MVGIDPDDESARRKFYEQLEANASLRIKEAVEILKQKGILDTEGKRINPNLPPSMLPGSPKRDLGF